MTPNQQQKEYIITEEQLNRLEQNGVSYVSNNIAEQVRTRPIAQASTPSCQACIAEMATFCRNCPHANTNAICLANEHDAAIRNATLDEVKKYADTCIWIDDDCCPGKMNEKEESDCDGCSYIDYPNNADICEKIESLRTTTSTPQQQERKE